MTARSFRRAIVSDHRREQVAGLLAVAVVASALILALYAHWLLAAVFAVVAAGALWLAGWWAIPGGEESYAGAFPTPGSRGFRSPRAPTTRSQIARRG